MPSSLTPFFIFGSITCCTALFAGKQPNILFIFTDDHAPHTISAYSDWLKATNPTPEIDKLAASGMLFANSFCTNSICGPSRAVIQTGKHSHKNGFMDNGNTFDWNQQTFPKLLQQAGYQTALYGKSHLKGNPQGFDDWAVLPGQGLYYNPDLITPEGKKKIPGYCTDVVTDLAVKWLEAKRDPEKPFMLMVQHKAPHRNWMPALRYLDAYDHVELPEPETLFDQWEDNSPAARNQELEIDRHMDLTYDLFVDLTPELERPKDSKSRDYSAWVNMLRMPPEQLKVWRDHYGPLDEAFHAQNLTGKDLVRWKYQRYVRNYLACLKSVDDSIARLRSKLKDLGLDENTIIIYSSDQGFYIGDHGWFDKRWMYEESLKMPLIVNWPGVTGGSVNQEMVQNLDYAPTFLDIAGAPIPEDLQGKSLLPLLTGTQKGTFREGIYYHYYEYPSVHMVPRHNGIRTDRYKLIHFYEFGAWEFYDLKEDPKELQNLYPNAQYAKIISTMKSRLNEMIIFYEDDSITPEQPQEWKDRYWKVP